MPPSRRLRGTTGCLTCRYRRKKCDEARPVCIACDRNHLLCSWPPRSRQSHRGNGESSAERVPTPAGASCSMSVRNTKNDLVPPPSSMPPILRRGHNRRLLDHFTTITSKRLAGRAVPDNPFLSYNLQIAFVSEMMQHTILAISSAHLLYGDSSQDSISKEHYGVALRLVKHALTRWSLSDRAERAAILATVLNLCWFEVFEVYA